MLVLLKIMDKCCENVFFFLDTYHRVWSKRWANRKFVQTNGHLGRTCLLTGVVLIPDFK